MSEYRLNYQAVIETSQPPWGTLEVGKFGCPRCNRALPELADGTAITCPSCSTEYWRRGEVLVVKPMSREANHACRVS